MKRKKTSSQKKLFVIAALVLAVIAVITILELSDTTHLFHKSSSIGTTTNTSVNAQKSNTHKDTPGKAQESKATDTHGQTSATTPSSQWTSSASGLITLQQPVNGATFKSGDVISGTAKVSQVWYRVVDDKVGLIGQGPISVTNHKFSATISFKASSPTGHLDVFSYQKGVEVNEISLDLKF